MTLDDEFLPIPEKPHPTSIWFLISSLAFFIWAFFPNINNGSFTLDLQLHDTYLVFSFYWVFIFFGIASMLFAGMYAYFNFILQKKLHRGLSITHFLITISIAPILFIIAMKITFNPTTPGRFDLEQFEFYQQIILIVFLLFIFGQIIFLGNIIRSVYFSFWVKNK